MEFGSGGVCSRGLPAPDKALETGLGGFSLRTRRLLVSDAPLTYSIVG